jgi:hypothetical protein
MTTLQQVHLKIQEIGTRYSPIPVDRVALETGCDREFIDAQILTLITLKFVCRAQDSNGNLELTLMGRMSNLP